jgi:uncharacterized RDD family membrane protein YckC
MLDTVRRVATPEGVELTLHPAGPVPRALAWLIDTVCRFAVYLAVATGLQAAGKFGTAMLLLTAFALEWIAPAMFEVMWQGATPGKRALGLQVLHDDGTPVGWPAALMRNIMRAADFLPVLYGFGLITMMSSRDFKRLGDIAAGTVVVHAESPRHARHVPDVPGAVPQWTLALGEQRALLDFAERVPTLTQARAEELAGLVPNLTGGLQGASAMQRLLAYANHLVGR